MKFLALRRLRYRGRIRSERLQQLWAAPSPDIRRAWNGTSFLACDLEMSGLDPASGELLSVGWVPIDDGEIDLGGVGYLHLRPATGVGASATVHGLRDCDFEDAIEEHAALDQLLLALAGRVLVFHNAPLDLAFLDRLALRCAGAPLLLPVVDTMRLEARRELRRRGVLEHGALRLGGCRARYGLPEHDGHNALEDALATAELLLAHCAAAGSNGPRLGELLAPR